MNNVYNNRYKNKNFNFWSDTYDTSKSYIKGCHISIYTLYIKITYFGDCLYCKQETLINLPHDIISQKSQKL